MKKFKHITKQKFDQALALGKVGLNNADVARVLKVSAATAGRMLKAKDLDEYRDSGRGGAVKAPQDGAAQETNRRLEAIENLLVELLNK